MNNAFPWRDLAELHQVDLSPDLANDEVRDMVDVWASTVEQKLTELDDQALAWETARRIKEILTILETFLAPRMHDQIPVKPGWADTPAGIFKRHWKGTKWHWDEAGVLDEITSHAAEHRNFNPATGEVEGEAQALLRHLRGVAAINYFRVNDLKSRGIDPEKYRTREDGRPWVAPA